MLIEDLHLCNERVTWSRRIYIEGGVESATGPPLRIEVSRLGVLTAAIGIGVIYRRMGMRSMRCGRCHSLARIVCLCIPAHTRLDRTEKG